MYSFTSSCIVLIYFLGLNFIECDDTKVCAAAADCTVANTKCIKDIRKEFDGLNDNFCAQLCDATKVDEQCGTGETCVNVKDIDGADVMSCVKSAHCLTDAFCKNFHLESKCNLYTLKCSAPPTTTTSTTTTTTAIVDQVQNGTNGCGGNLKYCNDPLWIDLMRNIFQKIMELLFARA
uniref:Uncharacterized protein n=1 Tax=Strongyloides venezuelensis TaxID=75913 RepID=A0A0K0G299_STRVS